MRRLTKEKELGSGAIHSSHKSYKGHCSVHSHSFFEIEYFVSGAGEHVLDGEKSELAGGLLVFMTPLNFHSFTTTDCRLYNTMFSESICDTSVLSRLIKGDKGFLMRVGGEDKAFLEAVFNELCHNYQNEEYASRLLNTVLYKLTELKKTGGNAVSPVSNSLAYITQHFQESLTLERVAGYAGFTPSYFSMLFKKETGVCFKEYLDDIRFEYAKKLIEHTDKTVLQVCSDSGFCDYPNFIRRFKRRYGITPGQVKKCL